MLTFEKIIEPVILLIKEEQNRLKNDEKLYNAPFAHFFIIITFMVRIQQCNNENSERRFHNERASG
ncbi:MAG: hypothetical protein IPL99_20810 [Candidatus Competibacteraceae bacterium]|nr:hypothetical protein [Candidatus Competibacteraceae bacterium]